MLSAAQAGAAETPALAGTGVVTMVHAVPGLVADVSVDGKNVLKGFTASRITDPVTLSAGPHTVSLKADNGPKAGKTVLTAKLDVTAGTTSTAVVGLTPAGAAKAFVFPESAVPVAGGQAAVVLRNVAATSPVKIIVDGEPLSAGTLGSGAVTTADVSPGTHQVVVKSASGATLLAAQGADLQAGRVTTLYLTGSQKGRDLSWVATTRLASSLVPLSAIPTGDGSTVEAIVISRNNVPAGVAGGISAIIGVSAYSIMRRRARARVFP